MGLFSKDRNDEAAQKPSGNSPGLSKAEEGELFYKFGMEYYRGEGGEQDYTAALNNLLMAAEEGHAGAARKIGRMYQDGLGVPQDDAQAAQWYRKAMDAGDAAAANLLGTLYDLGRGVPQDSVECLRLYRLAAAQGSVKAFNNLGYMYEYGRGVEQDADEARMLYAKAAKAGVRRAAQHIARMYEFGCAGNGQDINAPEAVRWYFKADDPDAVQALEQKLIDEADSTALSRLGLMYAAGRDIPKNYEKAVKFLTYAAEQGDSSVEPLLAAFYETGKGVEQDYYKAYRWYRSSKYAKEAVEVLEKAFFESDADTLCYIGRMLQNNAETVSEAETGFHFLCAAAEKGNRVAAEMVRDADPAFQSK